MNSNLNLKSDICVTGKSLNMFWTAWVRDPLIHLLNFMTSKHRSGISDENLLSEL